MMMHATFYWGNKVTILFDSWRTDSWTAYSISLLACFLFSVFYQYMEDRLLRLRLLSLSDKSPPAADSGAAPFLVSKMQPGGKWAPARFARAIMFGVNSAIGYLLMLAVMSYNAGVFLAVVVGLGVGYLLFRGSDEQVFPVNNPCACS